jgi:hypothetical protein
VSYVLGVTALEVGDPVANLIPVKANDPAVQSVALPFEK